MHLNERQSANPDRQTLS